jgi:hypothetical protein
MASPLRVVSPIFGYLAPNGNKTALIGLSRRGPWMCGRRGGVAIAPDMGPMLDSGAMYVSISKLFAAPSSRALPGLLALLLRR